MEASKNAGGGVKPDIASIFTIIACIMMNTIVLVIVKRQKELQEYMRVLYQILIVSDMVLGISWNIWNILWYARESNETCTIISMTFAFVYHSSLLVKIGCLCGISFNLYVLVTKPLRYYTIVTRTRFYVVLGASGAVILLVSGIYLPIPDSIFMKLLAERCLAKDNMVKSEWPSIVHTIIQIFPVCATMVFTTLFHTRLLCIARQLKNVTAAHENPRRVFVNHINIERRDVKRFEDRGRGDAPAIIDVVHDHDIVLDRPRKKVLKGFMTVFLLTGSFYIVWTPYVISFVIPMDAIFLTIVDRIAGCNTWVQPIIYLLTNAEARGVILKALRRCHAVTLESN